MGSRMGHFSRVALAVLVLSAISRSATAQTLDLVLIDPSATVFISAGCALGPGDVSWDLEIIPGPSSASITTTDAIFISDFAGTYYDATGTPLGSPAPAFLVSATIANPSIAQTLVFPDDYAPVGPASFVVPPLLVPLLNIDVEIDYLGAIAELSESNNSDSTAGVLLTGLDLGFASPPTAPATIFGGALPSLAEFGWTVDAVAALSLWTVEVFLTDGAGQYYDPTGSLSASPYPYLTASALSEGSFTLPTDYFDITTNPWPTSVSGPTLLQIAIDPAGLYCEIDESDNIVEFPVTLTAGAGTDLTVVDPMITSPATCGAGYCPGEVIDVQYTVEDSSGAGGGGVWRELIFLSTSTSAPTLLEPVLPSYFLIHCEDNLTSTGTRNIGITLPEIDEMAGQDLYLSIYVDGQLSGTSGVDEFAVPEIDEANNWTSSAVNYSFVLGPEPDLIATYGGPPLLDVIPTSAVTFEYQIANSGDESTELNWPWPPFLAPCLPGIGTLASVWDHWVVWRRVGPGTPAPFPTVCTTSSDVWVTCATESQVVGGMAPPLTFVFDAIVPSLTPGEY
ncbi:MAG: hypothetical protein KDC38_08710, partial [Planctomycetes bacterium]|nr:hypothetical protein [Planctomycetota bacterium]